MITNSHHSIISTTINISGFIKNNFRHCVPDQIRDLNLDDRNQNNRIVDISKITNLQWENFTKTLDREIEAWDFQQLIDEFNHKIQLGYETNNDEEKIRYKFNEIWNNIMSAISIAIKPCDIPLKLGSLMRKINKDQDFIDNKDDQWINFWLNRFNKYNKDYNRKEYNKFIDNHMEITIPTHGLFSDTWIKNAKEAVISNENGGVRLALDPDTIRTHAKDTFAGILRNAILRQ
ncbi:unnamed protein product [Rhizophagus irregularis]|nr:unnamed protein product [Rhizophagus irregularis]